MGKERAVRTRRSQLEKCHFGVRSRLHCERAEATRKRANNHTRHSGQIEVFAPSGATLRWACPCECISSLEYYWYESCSLKTERCCDVLLLCCVFFCFSDFARLSSLDFLLTVCCLAALHTLTLRLLLRLELDNAAFTIAILVVVLPVIFPFYDFNLLLFHFRVSCSWKCPSAATTILQTERIFR